MGRCCLTCKYCGVDPSVDDIWCSFDGDAEWEVQESREYFTLAVDCCTAYEEAEEDKI